MGDMLKKVKQMQDDLKTVHQELAEESYEAEAGGVRCVVSGDMEVKKIEIKPELLKSVDPKRLEFLVSEAVSSAMHEAKNIAKDKLRRVTGGLSIPGLL
jgi:DNA-binding YbaB/EbfC family protein